MKVYNIDSNPADKNWLRRGKKKVARKPSRDVEVKKNDLRRPRIISHN